VPFSLLGATDAKLSFWTRYSLETNFDLGYVYVSTNGGSTWVEVTRLTGASGYRPVVIDLSSYTSSSNVRLRFRIKSDKFVNADGWYVDDVVVSSADQSAPAAPQGLVATAGDGRVSLDWADGTETDLDSYRVSRTTDAPGGARTWTQIATATTSQHTDTAVANGTTYYYRVTALDTAGNESAPSAEASATPSRRIESFAPTSVTVQKGSVRGDPLADLADSDDRYFGVDPIKQGAKWALDWYASATVDAAAASRLTVTYEGSWTAPVTQRLYVRNFASGSWEEIPSAPGETSDATFTWFTVAPQAYVSGGGEVRLRVEMVRSFDRATALADQILFTIES
jgi:hypothetical protein